MPQEIVFAEASWCFAVSGFVVLVLVLVLVLVRPGGLP